MLGEIEYGTCNHKPIDYSFISGSLEGEAIHESHTLGDERSPVRVTANHNVQMMTILNNYILILQSQKTDPNLREHTQVHHGRPLQGNFQKISTNQFIIYLP